MPDLPPNFIAKESIFSIALVIGKPLTKNMATKNQTRPSCAMVKLDVDLVVKLPQRVRINEEDDVTGEVKSKWIQIQYDYMTKHYKECCCKDMMKKAVGIFTLSCTRITIDTKMPILRLVKPQQLLTQKFPY